MERPRLRRRAHRRTHRTAPASALLLLALAACDPPHGRAPRPAADGPQDAARSAAGGRPGPGPGRPTAAGGEAIRYRLSFDDARSHYVDVSAEVPTGGAAEIDLMMAVWTPGSYLVREYSRHVEGLAVTAAGEPLRARKIRKNRWRVETGGAALVELRYRLYAAELTVRTNWVSDELAVLNGAPTFITLAGALDRPHEVSLELPDRWPDTITALPPHPDGGPHRFLAPDYDTLVDAPIALGAAVVERFEVDGVPHRLAFLGDTAAWDAPRAAADVRRLVEVQRDFWGGLPYRTYTFIDVLLDGAGGGGLEHLESTLLINSPWAMRRRSDYLSWLGLVSHELFHAWNVKRLRPVELGPFDYENEVYTESLWVAEGITSYYDDLLLARAGLMKEAEYLEKLSEQIRSSETRPGRLVQPLAASSFDAWIKHYRPDENSANSSVDYYRKGAVVGFLFDAAIRRASGGRRSLDDAMRLAYRRHAGERGYTPPEMRAVLAEVAGRPLDDLWRAAVDEARPLELAPALDTFGLRFKAAAPPGDEPAGHLGLTATDSGGRLRVARVERGGPAFEAGLQAGDEIIAIDDRRVNAGGLDERLARHRPGQRVEILVSRWQRLRRIPVVLGAAPAERYELEPAPQASAAQRARRAAWLGR